ncbi:MAG: MarR family winged helix-turn-helix transcriptional regulator [Bacillota bacterium]
MHIKDWISLLKIFHRVSLQTVLTPVLDKLRISHTQFSCLQYISLHPGYSVINISKAFSISTAAATTLVDRLVRLGLINRVPNPEDMRLVKLNLTQKGNRIVRSVTDFEEKQWQSFLDRMQPRNVKALVSEMTGLIRIMLDDCKEKEKICLHCGFLHNDECPLSMIVGEENCNLG